MTTSSSRELPDHGGRARVRDKTPRYYRCRGRHPCPGSQVSAQDIEGYVLEWFRNPTGSVSEHARKVLGLVARRWGKLTHEQRQGMLAELIWEVRWDGPRNTFSVLLDETAIDETHLGVQLVRQEARAANARARNAQRLPAQPPSQVVGGRQSE